MIRTTNYLRDFQYFFIFHLEKRPMPPILAFIEIEITFFRSKELWQK